MSRSPHWRGEKGWGFLKAKEGFYRCSKSSLRWERTQLIQRTWIFWGWSPRSRGDKGSTYHHLIICLLFICPHSLPLSSWAYHLLSKPQGPDPERPLHTVWHLQVMEHVVKKTERGKEAWSPAAMLFVQSPHYSCLQTAVVLKKAAKSD